MHIDPVNQFASEMDHFSRCIKDGTEPRTPGEDGMQDVAIMAKIYEAAAGGGTVKV